MTIKSGAVSLRAAVQSRRLCFLFFLGALVCSWNWASVGSAVVVYFDDFDGPATTPLHGVTPDITTGGATWFADTGPNTSQWWADGHVSSTSFRNALLPFTPAAGYIYTASITMTIEGGTGGRNGNFGFFNTTGQSNPGTASMISTRMFAWFEKHTQAKDTTGDPQLSVQDQNIFTRLVGLNASLEPLGVDHGDYLGTSDLKVVLNTMAPAWTAQFFIDGVAVRGPEAYTTNPTVITHVGFMSYTNNSVIVDNFKFEAVQNVPGDFDADGDVDGADFVAWQTNFPKASGATLAEGDADADGDVDGADFVVWQTNFPFTPAPGASPVPEPGSLILTLFGVLFLSASIARRRLGAFGTKA